MPIRPPRRLPLALTAVCAPLCALLIATDARCGAAVAARADRGAPPPDSATVRRTADLVRLGRDVERAALGPDGRPDPTHADSARRSYLAAAALVPEVGDWLRLRAAGVTTDAGQRAAFLRNLAVPAARERAPLVAAVARARAGDLAGAAAALDSLGRPAQALGVRLQGATDPDARRAVRRALLDLLPSTTDTLATPGPASAAGVAEAPRERARAAAVLLDSAFAGDVAAPLAPAERLRVARALADVRDQPTLRRAAAAFAAARSAPDAPTTPADRFTEAGVLARLGRWREAAALYAALQGAPAPLGPSAAYERAHALVRAGDATAARSALRALADASTASGAADTAAAAARFLLAELTADDGREAEARAEYLRVAREQPNSRWAPLARFRAGVIALASGNARAAGADFDSAGTGAGLRDSTPDAASVASTSPAAASVAAAYWAGRAWAAAGDSAQARARWALALARDPASYYAWRAAVRLGRPWTPTAAGPGGTPPIPVDPAAEAAGRRAALLERIGLTPEAGYERDYLIRRAGDAPDALLAAAHALATGPRPGAGIRLAARAVERGAARTPSVWRLLDPLFYADALRRSAVAAGVDPALAAGVIRQESNFTADAVSPVGARGLMQLMPEVGRALWRGEGARAWSPDLLFAPEVNLALGMRHLAAGLRGYPDPAYALAAYNAGGARVTRWRRQPGADDPELFVERIPYAETRDYVRIVLRNRELYRALYGL